MKQKLISYIESELLNGQYSVSEDQDLLISGLVDSIGIVRLVAFIEKELDIAIPPKDLTLENFGSVALIAQYVDSQAGFP